MIHCPACQAKARITSRNTLDDNKLMADLYCECKNQECKARFVMRLSFKHWLNLPQKQTAQLAGALINQLPKKQRSDLLKSFDDRDYAGTPR